MNEYYNFLIVNKISPNGMYVLHAMHNNIIQPDYINLKTEQYRLELNGYLIKDHFNNNEYSITNSGNHIIREIEKIITQLKSSKKTNIPFSDWESKITEYNSLFPKGKKEGSSVSFRTNPKELFDKFKWFFKEYPEYTWEDVLTVTKNYVASYNESMDYTYMQTSKYFIKKEDKVKSINSTLATMCYNLKEGNDQTLNDGYHYFG